MAFKLISLTLALVGLILLTASAMARAAEKKPKSFRLTTTQLRELAEVAIAQEKDSPLSADELVAMCLVESNGDPDAVGDGGKAVGLFQFHTGTWKDHTHSPLNRRDPFASFVVAIRYAKRGARLCATHHVVPTRWVLWRHHNAGNIFTKNYGYSESCELKLRGLKSIPRVEVAR